MSIWKLFIAQCKGSCIQWRVFVVVAVMFVVVSRT